MPGFVAALKSLVGNSAMSTIILASGDTTIELFDHSVNYELDAGGAVTIATINADKRIHPGRIVHLIGATGTSAITFTNANATTTEGAFDLGGSDFVMDDDDVLSLRQREDGAWRRMYSTNN